MVGNLRLPKISCVIGILLFIILDASPAAGFVAPSISSTVTYPRYHGYSLLQQKKLARDVRRAKCIHHTHQHCKRTHLASVSASAAASTIAAGSTLVVSSLLGVLFDKNICTAGHVVTLLLAALLPNTSQAISRMRNISIISIPTDHFLYDWCWSIFLPASLVFALLSSSSTSSPQTSATDATVTVDDASPTTASKSSAIKSTILGMGLPFIAGSIGSILGCVTAFYAVAMPYTKEAVALLTGCLCASYIGGTVNFFATAKILKDVAGGDSVMGSAFGSMAAADLVVMAFYFAMLTAASKSDLLHRLFPSKCISNDEVGESSNTNDDTMKRKQSTAAGSRERTSKWSTLTAAIIGSSVALTSVNIATRLENIVNNSFPPPFNIPGTLCGFLAVIGLAFERLIRLVLTCSIARNKTTPIQSTMALHIANSFRKISDISPKMSDICFYLLFASVGATADLASAVAGGPMALVFASLALMVHSITVVLATSTCMHLGVLIKSKLSVLKSQWPSSSWEEVLTASNAAIGGPSTAAAFAAGLVPKDGEKKNGRSIDRSQYRSALVIGATVWGVFGYAIATGIGVLLSRFLMK